MTNEVVKYAPKAVIEELDHSYKQLTLAGLFENIDGKDRWLKHTADWFNLDLMDPDEYQELVAKHVLGIERLQPERENRWYVQDDVHGNTYWELDCNNHPTEWDFNAHGQPTYENGMTKEQATEYAELFGGEVKEIKR